MSAEGIVGAVDQPQWPSFQTKKPAAQLQSKKRGHLESADLELNFGLCNYVTCVLNEPLLFFNYSGRKPRHRRAESPTPDIIVKKDKYNKGIVT